LRGSRSAKGNESGCTVTVAEKTFKLWNKREVGLQPLEEKRVFEEKKNRDEVVSG